MVPCNNAGIGKPGIIRASNLFYLQNLTKNSDHYNNNLFKCKYYPKFLDFNVSNNFEFLFSPIKDKKLVNIKFNQLGISPPYKNVLYSSGNFSWSRFSFIIHVILSAEIISSHNSDNSVKYGKKFSYTT